MNSLILTLRNLSRQNKIFLILIVDFLLALTCWIIFGPPVTVLLSTNFDIKLIDVIYINQLNFIIPFILTCIYFYISGLYRLSIRFSDSSDFTIRTMTGTFIFGISWGAVYLFQYEIVRNQFLLTVFFRSIFLSFVLYASIQVIRDLARLLIYPAHNNKKGKPVLIYGAGEAGNELYHSLKNNPDIDIVGFYDNSNSLSGSRINNINIYGSEKEIKRLKEKHKNLEIYLAIPSLSLSERRTIISSLEKFKVAVRSIPALHEIVADKKKMIEMQDLSIDEILPRNQIKVPSIDLTGLNLMVTGAGGSIGSELVRQLLICNPNKIILFEISEINLYTIQSEIEQIKISKKLNTQVIGVLGDIKNKSRVKYILASHKIDHLYHAAAYKHVPIVEYHENIIEGINNNIFGTQVICESAIESELKKVVVISTDKAVRPTNVMGASKRLAEMVVQAKNKDALNTKFCMVRFGNVMNSSGSVIPLFQKQIANGGPVTITHKDVTRFFMTISEASSLVIQAGELADGGEVFILDMGEQIKILDLAKKLIYLSGMSISNQDGDGISIKEVGLRPGEKLYEELLISGDELRTTNKKIFKSVEKFLPASDLNLVLDDLKEKMLTNNVVAIKEILKTNVEGYNDQKNV